MASFRTALVASAATALSLAATPAALANGLAFTNYTTANGLGDDFLRGVYASGSSIYAATSDGLSIAQQSDPTPSAVPGPLPLFGAPVPSASPASCAAGCGPLPPPPPAADPLRPDLG